MHGDASAGFPGPRDPHFHTTRWSTIRAAGGGPTARAAREQLCRAYWYPLYAYLRRTGEGAEDAADLVQGFFAAFLASDSLGRVSEDGGRFRSYLIAALRHHASHERERAGALKRGGGVRHVPLEGGGDGLFRIEEAEARYLREPSTAETPERLYERRFATALLASALAALREEERVRGRGEIFGRLEPFLQGDRTEGGYVALAKELGETPGALKVAVHRLRQRWRRHLVEAVADLVESPQDVEEELQALFQVLERS